MQQRRDVDRLLAMWSEDAYPPPAPPYLSKVLERTRRTKQRRAWASLERWLPMSVTTDRQAAPGALRLAWILLIVLALVVAAAGIAVVGARLFAPSTGIPQGGAAVLALASLEGSNGEVGDVYTFNADGTGHRQLTGQVAGAVTSGAGIESATSWSPDGRRIAFRNWYNGNDLIEVMDAGGSNRQVLATRPQTDKDCADRSEPAWSPDGRTILYAASDSCDGPHTIYAVPSDGSAPPLDGFGLGMSGMFPTFSPDGTQIAFVGSEAGGPLGLYVADVGPAGVLAGGLHARKVGPAAPSLFSSNQPRWSPDGTEIAIHTGTVPIETSDIVIVKADGSGQRVLASDKAFNPNWSPDGTRVAFQRIVAPSERFTGRPCTMRIWVSNADGSGERPLDPLTDGCDSAPRWSPDGTRLLASLIVDNAFHVGVVSVDGPQPPVILPDGGASWQPVIAALPPAPSFGPKSAP